MGELGAGRTGIFLRGLGQAGKNIARGQNINYANITTPQGFMNIEEFERKAVMFHEKAITKEDLGDSAEFIENLSNDITAFYSKHSEDVREVYNFIHGKSISNRKAPLRLRERYWRSVFPELKENNFKISFGDNAAIVKNNVYRDPDAAVPAATVRRADDGTVTLHLDKKLLQKAYEEKAWKNPKIKGINPISRDFDTYEDWEDFVMFHEMSHLSNPAPWRNADGTHSRRPSIKEYADNENLTNKRAIEKIIEQAKKKEEAWSEGNYLTRVWNRHQIESNPVAFRNFLLSQLTKKYGNPEDIEFSTGLSVEQWENSIDKSIAGILTSPSERLIYENIIDPDSRLGTFDRVWDWIDNADLYSTDFVVKNFSSIAHNYMTGAVADTKFFKQFGTLSIDDIEASLREKMLRRIKGRDLTEKEKLRIEKDLSNIRSSLERVRGIYMAPGSPIPGSVAQRIMDSMMKFSNTKLASNFGIQSITDIGRPVIFMGLIKGLGPLFKSFSFHNAKNMAAMGKSNQQLKAFNVGNEINQQILISSQTNVNMNEKTGNMLERVISDANNAMFMANGLSNWNQHIKRSVGTSIVDMIITNARLSKSGKLPKEDYEKMLKLHLDKQDLKIIADEFEKHGTTHNGVSLMNFDNWDLDQVSRLDLYNSLSAGIRKEVDTIIVTPGMGDTPLIAENSFVKFVGQYRAFQIAALNRVIIPMTQQGVHPDLFIGILISAQLGQAVDQYNAFVSDREYDSGTWAEQLWAGLSDAAALGPFGMTVDYASLAAEGNPFGLGPSLNGIIDTSRGMGALGGNATPAEQRALQRSIPFARLLEQFIRPIESLVSGDPSLEAQGISILNNN